MGWASLAGFCFCPCSTLFLFQPGQPLEPASLHRCGSPALSTDAARTCTFSVSRGTSSQVRDRLLQIPCLRVHLSGTIFRGQHGQATVWGSLSEPNLGLSCIRERPLERTKGSSRRRQAVQYRWQIGGLASRACGLLTGAPAVPGGRGCLFFSWGNGTAVLVSQCGGSTVGPSGRSADQLSNSLVPSAKVHVVLVDPGAPGRPWRDVESRPEVAEGASGVDASLLWLPAGGLGEVLVSP